jgi:gamma-polyglutamate biosynthesis protein CapA
MILHRFPTSRQIRRARCVLVAAFAAALLSSSIFEPVATIALLGDVMLGRGVALAHENGGWEQTLQSLDPILRSADVSLANLESPIDCGSTASADPRLLVAPSESIAALTSAGLDIVSVANNHAMDGGERGAQCTREITSRHGISVLDSASDLLFSIHGIHLAFLAVDFTDTVSSLATETLTNRVRDLRREGNLVVVSLHWGMEYQSGSDDLQKSVARTLAGAGANILWGHHPHVVQKTDWIGDTLVFFSLGNAVFDQWQPATAREGELAWVEVGPRGVRFYAEARFSIDPRLGRTGPIQPPTFRLSVFPIPSERK